MTRKKWPFVSTSE